MATTYLGTYRSLDRVNGELVPSSLPPQLAELFITKKSASAYKIFVQHLSSVRANRTLVKADFHFLVTHRKCRTASRAAKGTHFYFNRCSSIRDTALRCSQALCVRFDKEEKKKVEHAGFCFQFADSHEVLILSLIERLSLSGLDCAAWTQERRRWKAS